MLELPGSQGVPWLDRIAEPETAIAALLLNERHLWSLEVAAALLVERPGDDHWLVALAALQHLERPPDSPERCLWEWLLRNLA